MAYIGRDNQLSDIKKIDSIAASFNGSTVTFPLASGTVAVSPATPLQLMISVGGVIQEPFTDYSVNGSTITFTAAPALGETFFGVLFGRAFNMGSITGTATNTSFTPVGSISSGNVQAAIGELAGDVTTLTTTVSTKAPIAGPTFTGNISLTGSGRYVADFSAALASRVLFQTSSTNGATHLGVIPNGTSAISSHYALNSIDTTNNSWVSYGITATDARIDSSKQGTGTYLPTTFWLSGSERARFNISGGFSVGTTADAGAGAIYATGNITAYYSDMRLKTVLKRIPDALQRVNALSGVIYTNNDVAASYGYTSQEEQVGVLAQEVESVLPQVVKPAPFDLDELGNSKSGENYKTVQYDRLVPLLIEAIKELSAEVEKLKGQK